MKFNKYLIIIILLALLLLTVLVFFQKDILRLSSSVLETGSSKAVLDEDIPVEEIMDPEAQKIIKAIYLTSWSASKKSMIDYLINIAETTEINAVVIDIKDFSGYVGYNTNVSEVKEYNAEQIRISDIKSLIKKLHNEDIYVIGRVTVFQDPVLAQARPDLAIHNELGSSLWLDNAGLAWIDPAAKESWNYNIAIAKDAISQGFDEINFDYVRFPSDGDLKDISYPFWDKEIPKHMVIKELFKKLREELIDITISVDLFGLSTVSSDDLGIGQIIEHGFEYFDYVCPMVYPSHYAPGFIGYENPAEYPYEVIKYSIEGALRRLKTEAKLRPWLQDFNFRAVYDAEMVRAQIKAVHDATGENFSGFMLWSSSNFYTIEALETK